MTLPSPYDAVLLVSFGGPEKPEDVMPFLENVVRGRPVPRERLLEVAEHYHHFGGRSPINDHCRELKTAIERELAAAGRPLPVYWGNRNWHPFLTDTVREMADRGVRRALAVVTSAFGSYSGCRRYLEDIEEARRNVGANAPQIDRLRLFFNHPSFISAWADRITDAKRQLPDGQPILVFTAHSIPTAMARSGPYAEQLREACRMIAEESGLPRWELVYQSRSGPPHVPWLEPDVLDFLRDLAATPPVPPVVLAPVGFLSDHIEVLYDLDVEAMDLARQLGIRMTRAKTILDHPQFIRGLREMLEERLSGSPQRRSVGQLPPCPDVCPADCCAVR
ncbi:ferrochelatase [Thermopirellula anaerolimosa]